MLNVYQEVLAAEQRIRPYVRQTPLDFSDALSQLTHAKVYLKCENLQHLKAFKIRGAFNKLLSLTPEQRSRGVVTASSGNHGTAVAFGLKELNIQGQVFVPENVATIKAENIRSYNVPLEFHGAEAGETEIFAADYAKNNNKTSVPPYNDPQVIGGQGTVALEIMQQLANVDAVLVAVGGGGLISGISGYIKAVSPQTQVVGCLPENSPVMLESIKAGHIVEMNTRPTLSDATAGGIEPDAITFEICQKCVDDYILVSEEEIKKAMKLVMTEHDFIIEGASGVAVAALLKSAERFKNKNVVVVLSGGNIGKETLAQVMK